MVFVVLHLFYSGNPLESIVLLAGVMLFVVFAVTEQDTIKSRANDMRTQIQDDLPRF